jgi:hypothetical protein
MKKLETAEADRDSYKSQLDDAQNTIKGFEGVDLEKINQDIADWKERAETAEKNAQAQILARDQKDFLKSEFDRLGVKSERMRESLRAEIMGEDGLKWKDGAFLGLSDYLAKENEKDHFYQTEEEKSHDEAEKNKPKFVDFTEPATHKTGESTANTGKAPVIF